MTDKTIKELAEEFHVSKQAIRKRLSADFRENYVQTVTRNGVKTLVVSYKGYLLLKQHFLGSNTTGNQVETVASNDENSIIVFLHEQLHVKDTRPATTTHLAGKSTDRKTARTVTISLYGRT